MNVTEVIDFSIHFHDLFTMFGDAYGRVRVGANIETLLGTGADYAYGGDIGAMITPLRTPSFLLSVRAQLGGHGGQTAGIVGLFRDLNAIADRALSRLAPGTDVRNAITELNSAFLGATQGLLTPFSALGGGVSVNAAFGLGPYLGLQASLGISTETAVHHPIRFDADLNQSVTSRYTISTLRPTFGATVDFNLQPLSIPLALLAEYLATPLQVEGGGEFEDKLEGSFEQLLALGLYYSERSDLQLGLTSFLLFGQAPTLGWSAKLSQSPIDLGAQFVFRYIW